MTDYMYQYFYPGIFYTVTAAGALTVLYYIRHYICRNLFAVLTTHFDPGKRAVQERIEGILDTSGKHQGWWIVALVLVLCLFSGSFFACEDTEIPEQDTDAAISTETNESVNLPEAVPDTEAMGKEEPVETTEPELHTASTLEEIRKYTDEGVWKEQVYVFLWNLLSGESEIPEYNTVKITDSVLTFAIPLEEYSIRWDFTVTESGLETLPPGTYHKEIRDIIDCYLVDPMSAEQKPAENMYEEARMISRFIGATYVWNTPTCGEGNEYPGMHNYLCEYYGNGNIALEEYIRLAREKFGAERREEDIPMVYEDNGIKMTTAGGIGGDFSFTVTGTVRETDMSHVTVQFYADCSSLLPSHKIMYHITEDGVFHGYDILQESPYAPYGLRYLEDPG